MDIKAYMDRIGLDPAGLEGKELLFAMHRAHATHIPFENLDPFFGRAVSLEPEDLFDKLVTRRRGGYCFEMNGFFCLAARQLGFDIEGRIARIFRGTAFGAQLHRINLARVGGETYICDVGFGGDNFVEPLLLEFGLEQPRGLETYRVMPGVGVDKSIQILRGDKFTDMIGFMDAPSPDEDFEVGNFYTSQHPSSGFKKCIMMAIATEDGRISLFNDKLTIRRAGAEPEQIQLPPVLDGSLKKYFGLEVKGVNAPRQVK